MPHTTVLLRILRAAAPAAVRIIASVTAALGRAPRSHREVGLSRATWYRHRKEGALLAAELSQNEKNQGERRSQTETPKRPPVDNSPDLSTGLARPKASCSERLPARSPQKRHLSTGQKRINRAQPAKKGGSTDAPFCGSPVRSLVETMRRDWLRAREKNRAVRFVSLGRAELAELEARLLSDGAGRILEVSRAALEGAVEGKHPKVYYERMFSGRGYEARARALDEQRLDDERIAKAKATVGRPLSAIERHTLALFKREVG